ncbi:TetR/AcrR family transcriptional regulator [Nocardia wallacei]|uniref:TetR/AcrR family transcriptional regulator n=1 Tax=Nocardia wallacei TaxID=480035 RepID=UPI0024569AE1|nr:TetR/AcrR family transcriptional regulator [Nocardia wallacei]
MAESRRGRPSTGVREAVLRATEQALAETGTALSTKEIARRAGVAESSIFYHFGDRLGLLRAVVGEHLPGFADAAVMLGRRTPNRDLRDALAALLSGLERFYLGIMPILGALQSDRQLRELLARREGEVGPHLALRSVAEVLRAEQQAGLVNSELDPVAGAVLLVGAAHQRALHRYLLGAVAETFLPSVEAVADGLLAAFRA